LVTPKPRRKYNRDANGWIVAHWIVFAPGELCVDKLTIFGFFAVTAMVVCYTLENRSQRYSLAFAIACLLAATYGFLQRAWPIGAVEIVWAGIALRRWRNKEADPACRS
jgi:hypothetical protein